MSCKSRTNYLNDEFVCDVVSASPHATLTYTLCWNHMKTTMYEPLCARSLEGKRQQHIVNHTIFEPCHIKVIWKYDVRFRFWRFARKLAYQVNVHVTSKSYTHYVEIIWKQLCLNHRGKKPWRETPTTYCKTYGFWTMSCKSNMKIWCTIPFLAFRPQACIPR